ncbi:hypothetical protein W822_17355 [Advenella kashmirensis W13003]|uniref:RiboL-PSP-HEPN domain-containing protein n=1 Tax=Advenella kashmirensis W13003 TaxID=1424334 RepID=V8QN47_9BURK|nr:hypothetical protein [Advenella kashmirensis]ETF01052.1 hypothetical protein W822_17355 [Advenella kashmirensis W13003]
MHEFDELAEHCAIFTLDALRIANEATVEALHTSGATRLVQTLKMIQLQKVILAVGMFSIFEASLQSRLDCRDGFREAKSELERQGENDLKEGFEDLIDAINALKHGEGRSYKKLVAKAKKLPFRVKQPNEAFYFEGDISEPDTLIQVDDAFVQHCGTVISTVYKVVIGRN